MEQQVTVCIQDTAHVLISCSIWFTVYEIDKENERITYFFYGLPNKFGYENNMDCILDTVINQ